MAWVTFGLAIVFLDVDIFIYLVEPICVDLLAKKLVGDAAESGLLACLNSNYLLIKSAKIARTVIADA